jgi:hypothetical protein
MNREEYRTGLWKKKSQKGTTYCTGKFKIGEKEYYLTLFNNDKKGNEKAPDFNLIIRDSINTQEQVKTVEIPPKIEPRTNIYAEFGDMVANDDDVIPF